MIFVKYVKNICFVMVGPVYILLTVYLQWLNNTWDIVDTWHLLTQWNRFLQTMKVLKTGYFCLFYLLSISLYYEIKTNLHPKKTNIMIYKLSYTHTYSLTVQLLFLLIMQSFFPKGQ